MEAGTVPNRDLDMLKRIQRENPEKAIVVIFTKRDKKELADQKKILKNANQILESNLSNTPISILAFSDRLDSPFLIKGSDKINDIIRKIWKDCNLTKSNDFAQSKKQKITDIFKQQFGNF